MSPKAQREVEDIFDRAERTEKAEARVVELEAGIAEYIQRITKLEGYVTEVLTAWRERELMQHREQPFVPDASNLELVQRSHCHRDPAAVGCCGGTDDMCTCECFICVDPNEPRPNEVQPQSQNTCKHTWDVDPGTWCIRCTKCGERHRPRGDDKAQPKPVASDAVNHPTHYTSHPSGVECIDIVEPFGFSVGNAIKYLWRAGLKGDAIEDLKKARWYVDREIARREKEAAK